MSSSTSPSASNPRPASQSQDDGVRIPDVPLRGSLSPVTNAQPQRQVMKLPSVTVPVLPSSSTSDPQDDQIRHDVTDPEDVRFPAAKILKIMKKALPADAKIAKPAKEDVERYAVEFIQFLTSEAAEVASDSHRTVINGNDILKAMEKTGFENYAEALRPFLERYKARGYGATVDMEVEDEGTAAVAAQRRRDRVPTPESPPSIP